MTPLPSIRTAPAFPEASTYFLLTVDHMTPQKLKVAGKKHKGFSLFEKLIETDQANHSIGHWMNLGKYVEGSSRCPIGK